MKVDGMEMRTIISMRITIMSIQTIIMWMIITVVFTMTTVKVLPASIGIVCFESFD